MEEAPDEEFGEPRRPLRGIVEDEEAARYRNRWLLFVFAGIAVVAVAFMLLVAPKAGEEGTGRPPEVAATIFPIYDIAREIAGDAVEVALVLPPNASPHTFEPTPSQVVGLQDVKTYFAIGHGLDGWTGNLFPPETEKVVVDEGLAIISMDDRHRAGAEHEDGGTAHEPGDTDPHYWLSIPNARLIAGTIKDALIRRFPEYERTFERNHAAYLEKLDVAEADIRDLFENVQDRRMITLHDAWYYFAVAYGFDIAGTFEPSPGREPTPKFLAELQETVDAVGAHVLYSEPQIAAQGLASFAHDNGLRIVDLDPLGGVPGRDTFIKLMKYDARTIAENQ